MAILLLVIIFVLIVAGVSRYFLTHDRGSREPTGALWAAFGFGILAFAGAAVVEPLLLSSSALDGSAPLAQVLLATVGIGFIEEGFKFWPLAWFIHAKNYFNEHTDGIIYFAICGMGFGLAENILYTLTFGSQAGWLRVLLVPFFHATGTGITGYYLARAKLRHESMIGTFSAFVMVALLHALYDFGLVSHTVSFTILSLAITIGLSIALFRFYSDASSADRAMGISAQGENRFCPHCGRPNVKHEPFCRYCGKLT